MNVPIFSSSPHPTITSSHRLSSKSVKRQETRHLGRGKDVGVPGAREDPAEGDRGQRPAQDDHRDQERERWSQQGEFAARGGVQNIEQGKVA